MIKRTIARSLPDPLYVFIYQRFYSKLRGRTIKRGKGGWIVTTKDMELLCPTINWLGHRNLVLEGFAGHFEQFFSIQKGDTALDVGACIGDTTIPMAIKVGATGRVIAVEPNSDNLFYLRENVRRFVNIEVIEKGVWGRTETTSLNINQAVTAHSITSIDHWHHARRTQQIEADTLDNLFSKLRIDYAKIDVQGAEVEVLKAADRFLKDTPKIVVGCHSNQLQATVQDMLKGYYPQVRSVPSYIHAWR